MELVGQNECENTVFGKVYLDGSNIQTDQREDEFRSCWSVSVKSEYWKWSPKL